MSRKVSLICLFIVMALLAAACAAPPAAPAQPPTQAPAPTAAPAEPTAAPAAADEIVIGYALPGPAPYLDGYLKKFNEIADGTPGVKVIQTMGDWTPQLQAQQLESMIAQKPDVMILWPVDNKAIIPLLARMKEQGIKMVVSNAFPEKQAFDYIAAYTGPSDVVQGRMAAQNLVKALGVDTGEVAMIRGTPGTAAHAQRAEGFIDELKKIAPNLKLVDDQDSAWGDKKKTYDVAVSIFQRHPNVIGIFSQDDTLGAAATQAAKDQGKSVKVVGVGGSCEAKELLKKGELAATTVQDPWEDGRLAIEAAIKVAKGESVEQITYIEPAVVTQENADSLDCHW